MKIEKITLEVEVSRHQNFQGVKMKSVIEVSFDPLENRAQAAIAALKWNTDLLSKKSDEALSKLLATAADNTTDEQFIAASPYNSVVTTKKETANAR